MNGPDLQALQCGDAAEWDEAFRWLWPVVLAVAQLKLQPYFPSEVEDVAIESLEELVPKVREVKTVEELRPLEADVRLAADALPLLDATRATAGEFPGYARERLQTKVRQTLGRPETSSRSASTEEPGMAQPGLLTLPELAPGLPARGEERRMMWRWRWLLGLAVASAAIVLLVALWQAPAPVIQIAMLDTAGASRGSDAKELALMQQAWNKAPVDSFSNAENARAWETNWPGDGRRGVVKILYDRAAGELRVLGRRKGKPFAKTFVVEQDFAAALSLARDFIREQTSR